MKFSFIKVAQWFAIGIICGVVLAVFLWPFQKLWDVKAFNLLFDVSYIPLVNKTGPRWLARGGFHFGTCICSLVILYHLLSGIKKELNLAWYIGVIGVGSSTLYLLTLLAHNTPPVTDIAAWILWTVGHLLFSVTGWFLIRRWIGPFQQKSVSRH